MTDGVRRANLWAALLQVVLAAWSIIESQRFPYWKPMTGPDAGFVPLWLGAIWLPIAVALVWQSRRPPAQGESPPFPRGAEGRRFLQFVLLLAASMALFEPIGALITVAAFVAVSLRLFEGYTWCRAALTGTVMSAVLYLIFRTWLTIPLPRGILFFF